MGSKILIAEDEEIISRELKTLLGQAGYQAVLAEDFQGLLPQIQREQPDLVLLDVNLPGCSGFDICAQIQEHAAGIPVHTRKPRGMQRQRQEHGRDNPPGAQGERRPEGSLQFV